MGLAQLAYDARNALAQGEVRLSDNEPVGETLVQADAASHLDGVLLEEAEARGGPARVEDASLGALDGIGELRRLRGDAGEMLQEVQGGPFSPKDADRRPGNTRHELAPGERHPIGRARLKGDVLVDQLEDPFEDGQTGQHPILIRDQLAASLDLAGKQ